MRSVNRPTPARGWREFISRRPREVFGNERDRSLRKSKIFGMWRIADSQQLGGRGLSSGGRASQACVLVSEANEGSSELVSDGGREAQEAGEV
jgi:hypothetical protein